MDSEAFRQTYRAMNERFCVFEKGILTNGCDCTQAERFCIAEREGVHCGSDAAQARCVDFLAVLRDQSRFALKTQDPERALPHAKAMRLQIGGLRGVALALDPDSPAPERVDDVHGLLERAIARFGVFAHLPFTLIMQQIAAYRGRRRRR